MVSIEMIELGPHEGVNIRKARRWGGDDNHGHMQVFKNGEVIWRWKQAQRQMYMQ
jgi:hypothetical protein